MTRNRVIPCLLVEDKGLVKTRKFQDASYVGDPINVVQIFNKKEVDEIIVLDINATVENRDPDYDFIQEIAGEAFMPFCYGGGVRTLDQLSRLFALGAEKVSLNTAALEDPAFVRAASAEFGAQSIVVSIDVRKKLFGGYEVCLRRGKTSTGKTPLEVALLMQEAGAGEILLNCIDRDGMMCGYDLALVKEVATKVSVPVIACGGAGSLKDCGQVISEGHASAAAAGSLFIYQGKHRAVLVNYPTQEELKALGPNLE